MHPSKETSQPPLPTDGQATPANASEQRQQALLDNLQAMATRLEQDRSELGPLAEQYVRLRQDIGDLIGEAGKQREALERARHQVLVTLNEEMERARQTHRDRMEADRLSELATLTTEQAEALRQQRDASLAALDCELKQKREELDSRTLRLGEEEQALTERRKEAVREAARLEIEKSRFEERRATEAQQTQIHYQGQIASERRLREQAERAWNEAQAERQRLYEQVQERDKRLGLLGHQGVDVLVARKQGLEEQLKALREELGRRPGLEDADELRRLRAEQAGWQRDRERLAVENSQLKEEQGRWALGVADLELADRRRQVAEAQVKAMDAHVTRLSEEVERLRRLYEQPQVRAARIEAIERPAVSRANLAPTSPDSEPKWLEQIEVRCASSGFVFPRRLLRAFHTSLKAGDWSPLVVLAGVSGTGKSEMPSLYARFGGLNFLPLSVQPNWDSPQSLLGFFNSVDNQFNATPLLRVLTQMNRAGSDREGLGDQLLLVLLDEMNLAHVELYFSDLLSKLEQRRGGRAVALEVDLGAGQDKHEVPLRENVLWVGTMNEDETTKSLSDKVIDRGNLLYFPRPSTLYRRQEATLASPTGRLPLDVWRGWSEARTPLGEDQVRPFKQTLEQMNGHLEKVGRAIGHRVWQSVEAYLALHPDVIAAHRAGDQGSFDRALAAAFEDQLVQKVMPKLRGIETSGTARRDCLDKISGLISGTALEKDYALACAAGFGGFVWRSAHYLEESP